MLCYVLVVLHFALYTVLRSHPLSSLIMFTYTKAGHIYLCSAYTYI